MKRTWSRSLLIFVPVVFVPLATKSVPADLVEAQAKSNVAEMEPEMERSNQEAQQSILAEQERPRLDVENLKNAAAALEVARVEKECEEKVSRKDAEVAARLAEAREDNAKVKEEAERKVQLAQQEVARLEQRCAESIASKDSHLATKISEAHDQIQRIQTEADQQLLLAREQTAKAETNCTEQLSLKDADTQRKLANAANEIERIQNQADTKVSLLQKAADEKIAKLLSTSEMEKTNIMEAEATIIALKDKHKAQENLLRVKMEEALSQAASTLKNEKTEHEKTKKDLAEKIHLLNAEENQLNESIEYLKSVISGLNQEVSFWQNTHNSQGYCNSTLIKQDSHKFVLDAMQTARGGFSVQMQRAQSLGEDGMSYYHREIAPNVDKAINEARDRIGFFYNEHFAETVNNNVIPVYNQHVRPLQEKHISPIMKQITKEAMVAAEKCRMEGLKIRSQAGLYIENSSPAMIKLMEENEMDKVLPDCIMTSLARSCQDGQWAFDQMFWWIKIVFVLLIRSYIYRAIWLPFSMAWYFCPLRFFLQKKGRRFKGKNQRR